MAGSDATSEPTAITGGLSFFEICRSSSPTTDYYRRTPAGRTGDLRRRCSAPQQGPRPTVRRGRWSISYSLYYLLAAPRNREGTFFAPHDKSSRNGRLLHGRLGGGRASGYLRERERRLRAWAAAPRRGAAVGGGLLGAKPERTKTCIYAHARQLLAAIVSPLVVVTRHHPLLLRECVLSGTATYGAARTVVYILFPILPPGGASKPRRYVLCPARQVFS